MVRLIKSLVNQLTDYFDPDLLGPILGKYLMNMLVGAMVLLLFWIIWRILRSWALPRWNSRLDKTSAAFVETVLKACIITIAVLAALGAGGIKTTTVLASLGVLGLTIGFAARDMLSNIISGILIFIDRPFTIDDLVEIEGNYGRVQRISLRSTRIITNDGKMLAVPNTEVMTKTVISYTNFPHLRLDIDFTIGVTVDIDQVRDILLSLVVSKPQFLKSPPPQVVVMSLNDYNTGMELRVWLDDERDHTQQRLDLRELVYKELTKANIEMPFETIQLASQHLTVDLNKKVTDPE